MRRKILPIILIVVLSVLVLVSCTNTTFTVTFDVDGQTYLASEVKKGGTLNLPTPPVKTGYTFDGWYLDKDVWTQPYFSTTRVINDITVYAHFIKLVESMPNQYTITFDSQGGSTVPGLRVKEGMAFELPEAPTLQDYNFAGWFLDTAYSVEFTKDYKLTRSIIVYAKWIPVDSTTYFIRNGSIITGLSKAGQTAATITFPETIDGVNITAIGDELFKNNKSIKSVTFPANSSYTTIGKYAFSGCTNLNKITLINGITTIGEGAFSGCTQLKNVQLPLGITTISKNLFYGCTSLQYANIYDTVTSIGDGAYYGCTSLSSVRIRAKVESIGKEAFFGCTGIRSVVIEEGVKSVGEKAFYNNVKLTEIILPSTIESLGAYAFYGNSSLTSATLSNKISVIPAYAFFGTKLLETLTIPSDNVITEIGECAFNGCTELETFPLPQGLTKIGDRAFEGCKDITEVTIPSGVTKIGAQTFLNAVNLVTVRLHSNVVELANYAFGGCVELTTITGTEGLTKLGSAVFKNCLKLNNVLMPATLTTIPDSTFESCRALTTITLSDGIKEISRNAFKDCIELESITLPLTLETLGTSAFYGAKKLNNLVLPVALKSMDASTFDGCVKLTEITVSSGNKSFEAENGIIYSLGKESMIFYSDGLEATILTIPNGVKKLYPSLFENNPYLVSVTAPDSLEEIGASTFRNVITLTSFNFTQNLKVIGSNAFEATQITEAVLPIGLHTIDKFAFKNTYSLQKATIPITAISVGEALFDGCRSTLKITVEGDEEDLSGWSGDWNRAQSERGYDITYALGRVTSGEYRYFARDDKAVLTDYFGTATIINVPERIDDIPVVALYKTFNGKSEVTDIAVPNSVELISEMTFKGMTSLLNVTLPFAGAYRGADGVGGLFGYAFDYSESSREGWIRQYAEGGALSSYYVEIPKSVKRVTLTDCESIAYGAFSMMHNLESIVLPSNVKEIKSRAFYKCSLVTVYLPESLEKIGVETFTINFNRSQDVSEGALSPQVTFNTPLESRPEGWVENCFDENSKFNFGIN